MLCPECAECPENENEGELPDTAEEAKDWERAAWASISC